MVLRVKDDLWPGRDVVLEENRDMSSPLTSHRAVDTSLQFRDHRRRLAVLDSRLALYKTSVWPRRESTVPA